MLPPSTEWKEAIAPDEEARFARQADQIRQVHAQKNARWGQGRFLHRKPLAGFRASLLVPEGLPEPARHGAFAQPGRYQALVRLSHGSFDLRANTKPDIRGFAVKVLGLSGPGALGGTADHQDFLCINHGEFASRTSDEFVEIVTVSAARGELGLVAHLIGAYGWKAGLDRVKRLQQTLAKPFAGYNAETFSTAVAVAFGPYAGKLRLRPLAPARARTADPEADMTAQVGRGPVAYEVAVQFFVTEEATPLENPPAPWSTEASPWVPVATLTLEGAGADLEAQTFDPWGGLAAHRPLGEIMRARKGAYYASQRARTQPPK